MRSTPRPGALGFAFAALLAIAGSLAFGVSPAHAATDIEVRGGAGGGYWPGRHVPLIVTVHADRLVSGTIRVTPDQGNGCCFPGGWSSTVEIPIEVAGGSTKDVVAVVPGTNPQRGETQQTFSAEVVLAEGELVLGRERVNLDAADWEETVGVLPKIAAAGQVPKAVPLRFNSGTANLVTVDPLVLDAGRDALGPFAAIVAAPNDLDGLAPAQRRAVLDWVAAGGHLLVDAERGPVAGLPDEWQPTEGWAIAGAGDVRLTRGQATAGRWANLLDPTAAGAISQASPNQIPFNGDPSSTLSSSLGADAGFTLPSLPVLIGALVAYVVIAGPVTFIVLARRRQRPLAWVVVPAIALAFTLVFAVVGTVLRNESDVAHGTVIDIGPAGARATTAALVGSVNGGRTTVRMPDGWTTDAEPPTSFGPQFDGAASPAALSIGPSGVEASVDLDPGEFSLLRASGPVDGYDRGVQVTATTDGTTVKGTIKNGLSVELHEVSVLVHQTATDVGSIKPGEEKPYEVRAPLTTGNGAMPELTNWPISPADRGRDGMDGGMTMAVACGPNGNCGPPPSRPTDAETQVNSPLWTDFAYAQQTSLRALGAVSVAGWTDELPSPLRLGSGDQIAKGRTAIVAHATIDVQQLDTVGARIEEVRDTDLRKDLKEERDLAVNGKLYRIVLPATVGGKPLDPTTVVIRPPTGFHAIAVPGATSWNNTPVQAGRIEYRVRAEDVVAGVIYVRTRIGDQFDASPDVELSAPAKGWQISIGGSEPGGGIDVSEEANNGNGVFVNGGGAIAVATTAPTLPPIVPPPDPAPLPGGEVPPSSVQPPLPGEGPDTLPTTPPPTFAPPGPVTGGGR